jgi:predicted DNA binding CopG/RHH family protein
MKKKVPKLRTDKAAEKFLAQDLSELDFSQFKPERLGAPLIRRAFRE